ncbi:MAG TPA: 4Fe-4S dicluster domain-containing protein, partial [Saprospiraceae bacterium]|nr:4Fe-4S dicluster domain-containing protein [Saprospiraceae bacterium]
RLTGIVFEKVRVEENNGRRNFVPTGEPDVFMEADDVIIAVGQDNAFPWIERDLGIEFGRWDLPVLDKKTFQSTLTKVFFGGDAAFGPENVITAVAHGHQAAISMDLFCNGKDLIADRPAPTTNLVRQKMGIHEWMYDSAVVNDDRYAVPHEEKTLALSNRKIEVELGFDVKTAFREAQRCLNCDIQTVFYTSRCIECDACVDICPTTCITFTANSEDEDELRSSLNMPALNKSQDLYVSGALPATGRVMIKDEDVCLHCGLCAERCPTAAWDMQKYFYGVTKATKIL